MKLPLLVAELGPAHLSLKSPLGPQALHPHQSLPGQASGAAILGHPGGAPCFWRSCLVFSNLQVRVNPPTKAPPQPIPVLLRPLQLAFHASRQPRAYCSMEQAWRGLRRHPWPIPGPSCHVRDVRLSVAYRRRRPDYYAPCLLQQAHAPTLAALDRCVSIGYKTFRMGADAQGMFSTVIGSTEGSTSSRLAFGWQHSARQHMCLTEQMYTCSEKDV